MVAAPFRNAGDVRETARLRLVRGGRRRWRWLLLALLAVIICVAAIVTQGAMVGLDLVRAREDLQAGRFDAAQAEFNQARDDLQHSWLLAPMHLIPPLQRQVDALALVADIGAHGAHAAMMGVRAAGTQDLA